MHQFLHFKRFKMKFIESMNTKKQNESMGKSSTAGCGVNQYVVGEPWNITHEYSFLMYFLVLFLSTVIGCVTPRPIITTRPGITLRDPVKQLQKDITAILSDSIFISTHATIKIVSVENGLVLYEHDGNTLMNPASTIKLITSAAALSVLDTDYQFKTSVFVDDLTADGDVAHNIYLKGFGDPDLTSSDLDSLAFMVHRIGINTIVNNIIVDDSFFDDNYWGDGWAWDDESDPDAPSINALSIDKNCILVNVTTDSNTISVSLIPNTDFVTVINRAAIAPDSVRIPLKLRRLSGSNKNTIVIEGDILQYSQVTRKIPLSNPALYAGVLFKESLRHAGVLVSGEVVNGVVPDGLSEITHWEHPISTVIQSMNKQSDNLSAENILKLIGAVQNFIPGSAKKGVFIENKFLSALGMDTTKFSVVDGSGVSRYNLFSADQLVNFLVAMKKQPRLFPLFYNSLPIAGIDGTLANRMSASPVTGNLRAKTGTLNGASCLSGYVQTRDGEMLAFSMMMQNFIASPSEYRLAQDKIGSVLAGFSRVMRAQTIQTK